MLNGYSQSANDGRPIEVGERFRPDESGVITAVRHFRGAGWAGTRTGHLWSNAGALLATAGTTYVVSYFSSSGDYAATPRASPARSTLRRSRCQPTRPARPTASSATTAGSRPRPTSPATLTASALARVTDAAGNVKVTTTRITLMRP